jgi:hypothetical protein
MLTQLDLNLASMQYCQPMCRITAVVTLSTDINSKNEMMFHEMTWYLQIEKERSQR